MTIHIDVNCDMGESYGRWTLGHDEEVMPHITSANVACGFHGGDPHVMRRTVELAVQHGVAIGAHPGLPDLMGFGLPSSSCLEGTPSVETVPALAPGPGELVFRKPGYDGFAGTSLDGALRARGVTSLVVTGTMTDICVLATVIGALHREYRVSVVEDGVATLWPEIQRATLDIIGRAYGRIVTSKDVAGQISSWS